MLIVLVNIGPSPFNRSIWVGLQRAFQRLGHSVQVVDHQNVPDPAVFPQPPGLFFAVHGGYIPAERVRLYRDRGVPTAVYLLDEPYEVDRTREWSQHYDWVFSVDRATVPVHAEKTNAAYLPLAYDDRIFSPEGPSIPSEILFLGSPFSARTELLLPLLDKWGDRFTWVGPGWREFSSRGRHHDQFVTPEVCAQFYRGAKVVINIHRDSVWSHFGDLNRSAIEATHLNPRFWEVAACGAFQLCSYREDLRTYAPKAASFTNAAELAARLEYFWGNAAARKSNATQVWKKVRKHTYLQRAREILKKTTGL